MIKFCVEGRGRFPYSMLHHDQCWPSSSIDAEKLSVVKKRFIYLSTNQAIVSLREWNKFSWRVTDMELE